MKNLMGCILPKGIMHSRLHHKIVDLAANLWSKLRYAVIDGIVGSAGSEEGGHPVVMNLIAASRDLVALDAVGSLLMGVTLEEAKYVRLAAARGLGQAEPTQIEVLGPPIDAVAKRF
jgi:uncharacterized protein (DUF362 family)